MAAVPWPRRDAPHRAGAGAQTARQTALQAVRVAAGRLELSAEGGATFVLRLQS